MAVKPGVTLVKKDMGLSRLFDVLREVQGLSVTVGVQGQDLAKTYPDGTPVSLVAMANEFGTKDIPARAFLRRAAHQFDEGVAIEASKDEFHDALEGSGDPVKAMVELGKAQHALVMRSFDTSNSWAAPDDLDTVEEKRSMKPLTDTGLLRKSISWAVRCDDQIVATGRE